MFNCLLADDSLLPTTYDLPPSWTRKSLMPVARCCNGTYEEPTDSRRQHTVAICVPDGAGWSNRVCKKTFKDIFAITSSKKLNYVLEKRNWMIPFTRLKEEE